MLLTPSWVTMRGGGGRRGSTAWTSAVHFGDCMLRSGDPGGRGRPRHGWVYPRMRARAEYIPVGEESDDTTRGRPR